MHLARRTTHHATQQRQHHAPSTPTTHRIARLLIPCQWASRLVTLLPMTFNVRLKCCSWLRTRFPCTVHTLCSLLSSLPPNTLSNEAHSSRRQTPNNLARRVSQLVFSPIWFYCFSGREALRAFTILFITAPTCLLLHCSVILRRLAYQCVATALPINDTATLSTLPRLDTRVNTQR